MPWRQATVVAGVRLDADRRHVLFAEMGPSPPMADALRRFLHLYGPATIRDFAEWAWLEGRRPRAAWEELAGETVELAGGRRLLAADLAALESPPEAEGVRLLPPGDPYLQKPNRPLLAPDPELRTRLFRPAGSPGAVLKGGRLAGLWRLRGGKVELEPLERLPKGAVEEEVERVLAAAVDRR